MPRYNFPVIFRVLVRPDRATQARASRLRRKRNITPTHSATCLAEQLTEARRLSSIRFARVTSSPSRLPYVTVERLANTLQIALPRSLISPRVLPRHR